MPHFALLLSLALDVYPCQITLPNTAPRSLMGIGGGCGDSAQPTAQNNEPVDFDGLQVLEFVISGNRLSGTIRNNRKNAVSFVRINYKVVQASDGSLIETNFTFVQPQTLAPGETGQFGDTIKSYPVSISVKITSITKQSRSQ